MDDEGGGVSAFSVRGLTKTYPGADRPAVAAVDLVVPRGEVFGLLGPNGAGKSTLVRQLVGLCRPTGGEIRLLGHDVLRRPEVAGRLTAYLPQDESALAELPVRVAVHTTGRLRGLSRRSAATAGDGVLAELGLAAVAGRALGRLSGGQRRLAAVATALVGGRPVLVLDEPTTGLDPTARRAVWDAVARRRSEDGVTVVLVTHNVLEAESVLDRVAVLDRGRVIACDSPGRLKALVGAEVRLDLVWRASAPESDPVVARLGRHAVRNGRRWTVRLSAEAAAAELGELLAGPSFGALDDFTLATPSLEDVYLRLGGAAADLERV